MRSSSRYLTTVRRATGKPRCVRASAMAWSLRGASAASLGDQGGDDVLGGDGVLEEDVEGDDFLRGQLDVLVQQGAADGALVQVQALGQPGARQGPQERPLARLQKPLLQLQDGLGDALDGAAALLQVLQEQVGPLDVGDDVLLVVGDLRGACRATPARPARNSSYSRRYCGLTRRSRASKPCTST